PAGAPAASCNCTPVLYIRPSYQSYRSGLRGEGKMYKDPFSYAGKNILVIGGATGMGAATAQAARELGARVAVMDVAEVAFPVDQAIRVDLRDQASVEAALAQVSGPLHAVIACAGVADGVRGLMLINFISQRKIVEALVEDGRLGRGGAIALISSV